MIEGDNEMRSAEGMKRLSIKRLILFVFIIVLVVFGSIVIIRYYSPESRLTRAFEDEYWVCDKDECYVGSNVRYIFDSNTLTTMITVDDYYFESLSTVDLSTGDISRETNTDFPGTAPLTIYSNNVNNEEYSCITDDIDELYCNSNFIDTYYEDILRIFDEAGVELDYQD